MAKKNKTIGANNYFVASFESWLCSDDDNDNCLQARKKNLQDDGIVWKKPGEEEQNKNDKLLNMNVTNDGNGDGDNDDDDHHHRNKSFSETKNEKKRSGKSHLNLFNRIICCYF